MVDNRGAGFGGNSQRPRRRTVILSKKAQAKPLGMLIITSGEYAGTKLDLGAEQMRIGSDGETNDHMIDDEAVSGLHLSIRFLEDAGVFLATDLASANGTFVNGERIHERRLASNDVILIGETEMTFIQLATVNRPANSHLVDPSTSPTSPGMPGL